MRTPLIWQWTVVGLFDSDVLYSLVARRGMKIRRIEWTRYARGDVEAVVAMFVDRMRPNAIPSQRLAASASSKGPVSTGRTRLTALVKRPQHDEW